MDKNLQFLVRNDVVTVDVRINGSSATYTYVAKRGQAKENDVVVVPARGNGHEYWCIGVVQKVDDDLEIDPGDVVSYRWIVAVVDSAKYEQQLKIDAELRRMVKSTARERARAAVMRELNIGAEVLAAIESPKNG